MARSRPICLTLALLACLVVGCERPPARPGPRTGEVTGTVGPSTALRVNSRLAEIDRAIDAKAFGLPALVKGLVRDLKELKPGFTGNAAALDAVTRKLEDWHKRSNDRRIDADADRAELAGILDEVRAVLKTRPDSEGPASTIENTEKNSEE